MIQLMITTAGLDALVNAGSGATDPIRIVSVGLSANHFVMAPTLTAVPGEIKRLTSVSGQSASETIIHMTAQDTSADIYDLRGLGLYLEDGTLFAAYSQAEPIVRKVSIAFFLLALDVAFANAVQGEIVFGDTSFLLPPATETVKGSIEIATSAEAAAGTDHERAITPLTLQQRLAALSQALNAAIAALAAETDADLSALASGVDALLAALVARTITGGGLVTGGGDLSASRVLTVPRATVADLVAGTSNDVAITPLILAGMTKYLGQNGYCPIPGGQGLMLQWGRFTASSNSTSSTLFPLAFPSACLAVVPAGGVSGGADSQDNPPVLVESSISLTGFSVFSADDSSAGMRYIAVGL
ncbi:gp53-like domain-containing protein [Sphingomonas bisphenolicum]